MSVPAATVQQAPVPPVPLPRARAIAPLVVGLLAVFAALALPFAPVTTTQTTVQWPATGAPPGSTTAFFTPPRPAELTVTLPCAVVRAGAAQPGRITLFSTGPDGSGLGIRAGGGRLSIELAGRVVADDPVPAGDCAVGVRAGPGGVALDHVGQHTDLPGEQVPEVSVFRTDLDTVSATGLTVTAQTAATPWDSSPTPLKVVLAVLVLALVVLALGLLRRIGVTVRDAVAAPPAGRGGRWRWLVDAGVLATLAGWAVIGPVTDDDGFASAIARTVATTGDAGNYYRWWNASETPFALSQQLLAPLTEVSLAPLWLRLPSTLLGVATWFVVSRGVLGALPGLAVTGRLRLLAALCFLVAWLPFNLGTRPEPYVALGTAAVLAVLLRARSVAGVGAAVLVAGLTVPASPAAVLVLAPVLALAPKIGRLVRAGIRGRAELLARLALLGAVAAVPMVLVFADQSWRGVAAATEVHNRFGPSLAWHEEIVRYLYLLGFDSQGSAAKRLPVLLALALLVAVAVLLLRRRAGPLSSGVRALAWSVALGFGLLCVVPSKWSHHFGALAGLLAPFLVVAVVLLARAAGAAQRVPRWVGPAAGAGVAIAVAAAFAGPNAWYQPVNYPVPWADGPIRPLGLPLDSPVLWLATVGVAVGVLLALRRPLQARVAVAAAPAVIAVLAATTGLAVLVGSFAAAPAQRPGGYTLAAANVDQLTGGASCGIADDVEVLPDVPGGALTPVSGPTAPFSWDSRAPDASSVGELTSPWFTLPPLGPDRELAVPVSGRVGDGTTLALQFGTAGQPVATVAPQGPPTPDPAPDARGRPQPAPPDRTPSRGYSVTAGQVPSGVDQVRVLATDAATDPDGWLAVTGPPRLRQVVPLTRYLAGRGPVLVDWPIAFLLPCQLDTPRVAGGLAQAPVAVVEPSRRYPSAALAIDPAAGGDFAALPIQGRQTEVPTRLRGSPELDWGHLVLVDYGTARDAYTVARDG